MLRNTVNFVKARPFTLSIPKSRDPRDGYWNVPCMITEINDTRITYAYTCGDWLVEVATLPIPRHNGTLYECIRLSISETIVEKRIAYLCANE
jgi:hypothetical protein